MGGLVESKGDALNDCGLTNSRAQQMAVFADAEQFTSVASVQHPPTLPTRVYKFMSKNETPIHPLLQILPSLKT